MSLHLDFFGFNFEPFSKEIADHELWLPPSKKAIVEELVEAIEARESVVLTGEPGAEKPACSALFATRCPPIAFG